MPSITNWRSGHIGARGAEIRHLKRYCAHLKTMLEAAGYHIVDSQALHNAFRGKSDQELNGKVRQFCDADNENNNLIYNTIQKRNAFVSRAQRLIGLPKCAGLLKSTARQWGLNSERLQQAGLCDMHLYGAKLIHEASHVMGWEGRYWDNPASFEANEPHTYLHHMTRFMRTTGFKPTDSVPNLLADLACINNTIAALRRYETGKGKTDLLDYAVPANEKYRWTHHAGQWAITRANKDDPADHLWDKRGDRFRPIMLKQHFAAQDLRNTDKNYSLYELASLFLGDCIRKKYDTGSKGLIEETADLYELCDMAWQAGRNALDYACDLKHASPHKQKGGTDAEKAALILRQLARSIDHVKRYADDYKPPANGARITHRCQMPGPTVG